MIPLLKWPGGKRWFVTHHSDLLPSTYNRFFEPFLGGGSVFFHLQAKRSVLGDTNPELIAAYEAVKRQHKALQTLLEVHQRHHCADYYYRVRDSIPAGKIARAARTFYLNRTCFNGIYRVNTKGKFNVPVGTRASVIRDTDDFAAAARLLKTAELRVADFEPLIDESREGDLVFADPPYTVQHNNNGFVKYNELLFRWADQERLAETLKRAKDRGVKVVATNADHSTVRELYERVGFAVRTVERNSSISGSSSSRKRIQELVILANC